MSVSEVRQQASDVGRILCELITHSNETAGDWDSFTERLEAMVSDDSDTIAKAQVIRRSVDGMGPYELFYFLHAAKLGASQVTADILEGAEDAADR